MAADKHAFAQVLKGVTDGRSVRSLADQTGWGRSTVHEWLVGVRLPSAQQVEDLLAAVGASPEQSLEIERLRSAAARRPEPGGARAAEDLPQPSGPPPDGPDGPDGVADPGGAAHAGGAGGPESTRRPRLWSLSRHRLGAVVLAGLLVVGSAFAGGFATGRGTGSPRSSSSALPEAAVQGTLGRGLFSHRGPDGATERVGSLYEGQVVHIACISPTGGRIEDDTMHESRDDWALLSDGTWVSVLYLDIHREWTPPQLPPAPLTIC